MLAAVVVLLASAITFTPLFFTGDLKLLYATALAPLVIVAVIRSPFGIALAYFAFVGFRLPEAFPILTGLDVPRALGIILLLALALHYLMQPAAFINLTLSIKLLGAFLFVATIGLFTSSVREITFQIWSDSFFKAVLAGISIVILGKSLGHIKALFLVVIGCGLSLASIAVWNKYFEIGLVEQTRAVIAPGVNSILADPNFSSQLLIVSLGMAAALAVTSNRAWLRLLLIAACTILCAGVIVTQSRGALLGLLSIFVVIGMRMIKSRAILAIAGMFVAAFGAVLMGLSNRFSGSTTHLVSQGLDASADHRLIAWDAAFNMALSNPLTGVGIGSFSHNFFFYTNEWVGRAMDVHSTWMLVLAETGFIGFGFFMGAFIVSFLSLYRSIVILERNQSADAYDMRSYALGLYASITGYCVTASFISSSYAATTFGLIAMASLLTRIVSEKFQADFTRTSLHYRRYYHNAQFKQSRYLYRQQIVPSFVP